MKKGRRQMRRSSGSRWRLTWGRWVTPQATTDPKEEAAEEKEGTRKLRWADCDDKEEEEDHREAVRKSVEMRQKEKLEPAVTDPGEEGWKRKVLWLDCSDEEQERQEREAGERREKCEV